MDTDPAERAVCAERSNGNRRRGLHWVGAMLISMGAILGGAAYGASPFGAPYLWYEQGRAHRVWVDPNLIAQLRGSAGESSAVHGLNGLTRVPSAWGSGVQLWHIPAGSDPVAEADRLNQANPGGSTIFVPVFRDAPNPRAPMRLLGNEVLAALPSGWDRARVQSWAAANGLTVLRKMPVGTNAYLLRSTLYGVALLQSVERIRQAGIVRTIYPNWRRALALR